MNDNVVLSLNFRYMDPKFYKQLEEQLSYLNVTSATVYLGRAGTVRNALALLRTNKWFEDHVSLASLIIDGEEYNILHKLDRFSKYVVYYRDVDTKDSLKKLIS